MTTETKKSDRFTRSANGRGVNAVTTVIRIGCCDYLFGGPDVKTLMLLMQELQERNVIMESSEIDPNRFQTVEIYGRSRTATEASEMHAFRKEESK